MKKRHVPKIAIKMAFVRMENAFVFKVKLENFVKSQCVKMLVPTMVIAKWGLADVILDSKAMFVTRDM